MIVESELRAWAADRHRHRDLANRVDRFARDWKTGPVRARIADAFAPLDPDDESAIADAAAALFEDGAWIDALIDSLAAELRRDPFFDAPFSALNSDIHSGLLVHEDDKVAIAAGVTRASRLAGHKNARRSATSVNFTGQISVLKFVKAGGATLSFWEAPPIAADFCADAAGPCRRTGSRRVADGEIVRIDGRRQAYVIDHVRSNIVLLHAEVKAGRAPLSVEYDSESGAYVGCSAVDDSDSRIQMITTLVRRLGHDEAVPVLTAFLDHPSFFVRWHVLRELLGIDVGAALPHLRRMAAEDPHPDARRAAASVVDRAEQALGERKAA